jgi:hypothetical protein
MIEEINNERNTSSEPDAHDIRNMELKAAYEKLPEAERRAFEMQQGIAKITPEDLQMSRQSGPQFEPGRRASEDAALSEVEGILGLQRGTEEFKTALDNFVSLYDEFARHPNSAALERMAAEALPGGQQELNRMFFLYAQDKARRR